MASNILGRNFSVNLWNGLSCFRGTAPYSFRRILETRSANEIINSVRSVCSRPDDLDVEHFVSKDDVGCAIRKHYGQNLMVDSYFIENFTNDSNYDSYLARLGVNCELDGREFAFSYILKILPRSLQKHLNIYQLRQFERERNFYTNLYDDMKFYFNDFSSMRSESMSTAMYYMSHFNQHFDAIFLEDLRSSGFKPIDRTLPMDVPHAEVALKELAKFHAASIIGCSIMQKRFSEVGYYYPETHCYLLDKGGLKDNFCDRHAEIVEKLGHSSAAAALSKLAKRNIDVMETLLAVNTKFRIMAHGNFTIDNLLFNYCPDGTQIDCRIMDFKNVRIGSPALDLNTFFYTSLDHKTRKENMNNLLQHYHNHYRSHFMDGRLNMCNFTYEQLVRERQAKRMYGFIMGMDTVPFLLSKPDIALYMANRLGTSDPMGQLHSRRVLLSLTDENISARLNGMIEELSSEGLFDGFRTEQTFVDSLNSVECLADEDY